MILSVTKVYGITDFYNNASDNSSVPDGNFCSGQGNSVLGRAT